MELRYHRPSRYSFGPTTIEPLGWVALGSSGAKALGANVRFFARSYDEWHLLCSLLTVAKVKELLGAGYNGQAIGRFEIPWICAVHFLLNDHLDRGWCATSTYEGLGKNARDFLRAKHVEIPTGFLETGNVSH